MNNEKILRKIRLQIFDYSSEKQLKAGRIIEALKQRIIKVRPKPEFKPWMYLCE